MVKNYKVSKENCRQKKWMQIHGTKNFSVFFLLLFSDVKERKLITDSDNDSRKTRLIVLQNFIETHEKMSLWRWVSNDKKENDF